MSVILELLGRLIVFVFVEFIGGVIVQGVGFGLIIAAQRLGIAKQAEPDEQVATVVGLAAFAIVVGVFIFLS